MQNNLEFFKNCKHKSPIYTNTSILSFIKELVKIETDQLIVIVIPIFDEIDGFNETNQYMKNLLRTLVTVIYQMSLKLKK